MRQIQISDEVYQRAKKRATAEGCANVDSFIDHLLAEELIEDDANLDHLFTPEIIASLDKSLEDAKAGKCRPATEVFAELAKRR